VKQLRHEIADLSRLLHERGWVANHDGNISARGDGKNFIATPTATSKRLVTERTLIEVDPKGAVVGAGKVFGEIGLHLTVYERRRDVGCVIHAHPPAATAIASAPTNIIARPFIAEAVVSLGALIPRTNYAQPGDAAKQALAPWCELVDAVLLGNHGVIAWGADPEQAFLRLELVEHLAKIAIAAAPIGGIAPLPESAFAPLLAGRAKAKIGLAADNAEKTAAQLMGASDAPLRLAPGAPVVACAPAPHANVATIAPGGGKALADIVREEIVAALRR
jgi:L-fuculose-phosphate aldolase